MRPHVPDDLSNLALEKFKPAKLHEGALFFSMVAYYHICKFEEVSEKLKESIVSKEEK